MPPLLQDLIVAAVALGAAAVVVRQVLGTVRQDAAEPGCEHCAVKGVGSQSVENSRTSTEAVVREFSTD